MWLQIDLIEYSINTKKYYQNIIKIIWEYTWPVLVQQNYLNYLKYFLYYLNDNLDLKIIRIAN